MMITIDLWEVNPISFLARLEEDGTGRIIGAAEGVTPQIAVENLLTALKNMDETDAVRGALGWWGE